MSVTQCRCGTFLAEGEMCERCPAASRRQDAREWLLDAKVVVDATEGREDWWGPSLEVERRDPDLDVVALATMFPDWHHALEDLPPVSELAGEIRDRSRTDRAVDETIARHGPVSDNDERILKDFAADVASNKYDHVRRATQDRDHTCHWPGCKVQCKPAFWGCRQHWYALPKDIQNEIWRTYEAGQEQTMTPSDAYLRAANRAQAWIRDYLGGATQEPRRRSWDDTVRDTRSRDRGRTRG